MAPKKYIPILIAAAIIVIIAVGLLLAIPKPAAPTPTPTPLPTPTPTPTPIPSPTPTPTPTPSPVLKVYEIGVLLPLSGELASFGAELKTILLYAESEINKYLEGLGRGWRIKLIVEDTAVDPKTHFDKLVALHGRGVKVFIGGISSGELRESLSYCNANNILIISPSSTSPALSLPDMALRYVPPDQYQGKAIAKIMWERGIRWFIPMWRGDTWGDGLVNATIAEFSKICKASGESCGVILPGIRYDPATKEFTLEVSRLASYVSEAVGKHGKDKVGVLLISFGEASAVFAAAKDYPILSEIPWQGSDGTANIVELLDPGIADMVAKVKFYSTMASPGESPKTPIVREVINRELGRDPMGYTYFAYDILWTVALAIDKVGYDPVAVKNVLPEVLKDYVGASGRIMLDENGDRSLAYYDIWVVVRVDGDYKWEVVGLYDGEADAVIWKR